MKIERIGGFCFILLVLTIFSVHPVIGAESDMDAAKICPVGVLKPLDSQLTLKVGDKAPDFSLPSVTGERISLASFKGKKNVVLSFVPAAWTPVCSGQWPGYNIAQELFDKADAVLIGITADNIPTLYAWTEEMGGVWFPVLSDFWPHGAVAAAYGVLRTSGTTERALFVIDKDGVIQYIHVHDINEMPQIDALAEELKKLEEGVRAGA